MLHRSLLSLIRTWDIGRRLCLVGLIELTLQGWLTLCEWH